jgi:adenylate kinase
MIILIGVPGSGKSTQAQILVDRGKLRWLSTGEILRNNASEAIKSKMMAGALLDDDEMIDILQNALSKLCDSPELILDGFPRSEKQSNWLLRQHNSGIIKLSCVVSLEADRTVVEKRLMDRGRDDDNIKTIDNRFDVYQKTFIPVLKILEGGNVPILRVDADQTVEQISKDIISKLSTININA